MKTIQIKETSTMINAITEMMLNKEIQLYKSDEKCEMYTIKNTDIYICLINTNGKLFETQTQIMEYNTQIIKNLYIANNLRVDTIKLLYNNYVFMLQ